MNICYFIGSFQIGGAENMLYNIISNLDRKKFNVFIAVNKYEGQLLSKYESLKCPIYVFPKGFKRLSSIYEFYNFLKKNNIECLHLNLLSTFSIGITAAVLAKTQKVITHWHNVYGKTKRDGFFLRNLYSICRTNLLMKYSYNFSHNTVAISKKVKFYNCNKFNISKKKVSVIYNAIDFKKIPKNFKSDKNNYIKIGTVGKVCEQKGIDELLIAFSIARKKIKNLKLEIIGNVNFKEPNHYTKKIKSLVENLGLSDDVFFTGNLDYIDVFKKMDSWKLFVLSSKWEGFGLVIIEAMAFGKAVIASDVDAIPEIIDHGKNGIIYKSGNTKDLSSKIISLISNDILRNQISEKAKKSSQNRFNIDRMIFDLEKIYFNY